LNVSGRDVRSADGMAGFTAETWASVISSASDLTMVVDRSGVIRDVSVSMENFTDGEFERHVGRAWTEIVTLESRPKIAAILRDATEHSPRKWRHINYPGDQGGDLPLLCSAIQVGNDGRFVAFARDLRSVAVLQRKMIEVQQSMDRDYRRLRHFENRFEVLFRQMREAVILVDNQTLEVLEANPSASKILGLKAGELTGKRLPGLFLASESDQLLAALGGVRASGKSARLPISASSLNLAAAAKLVLNLSMFRQERGEVLLIRIESAAVAALEQPVNSPSAMLEKLPDGFVVTDLEGRILSVNPAFLDLIQFSVGEQVRGESIARWLGRGSVDLNVLIANLRQHGVIRLFATAMIGQYGASTEVEIGAAEVPDGEPPCLGFSIRDVGRRLASTTNNDRTLPKSVAQLTELVGRVPLKDIVGQTTDLIEQLCIEAALSLTKDNRASAAEMLGVSRQNLYVKLRRFGLHESAEE
jgi:transcriptional regulator PpsR